MSDVIEEGLDLTQTLPDDEAAFEAGFAGESEVVADTPTEAPTEAPTEEPTEVPSEAPTEEPTEVPSEAPKAVLAGLTEDQIVAALAKTSQLQSAVDRMNGKIGSLMQRLEAVASAPKTAAEQKAFDLKLEKLTETFPELAEILREDLKLMSVPVQPVEQQPAQPTFTPEDVERILSERLNTFQQQQLVAQQVTALGAVHPDWEQVIRTPDFAVWRDNVIEDGAALMESENAAFISQKLSEFKSWRAARSAPQTPPAQPQVSNRLKNAVLPTAKTPPATGPMSEDDIFEASFAKARKNY